MQLILTLLVAALMFAAAVAVRDASCHKQWSDFNPTFSVIGDCMIEFDGKRIPASAYREMP